MMNDLDLPYHIAPTAMGPNVSRQSHTLGQETIRGNVRLVQHVQHGRVVGKAHVDIRPDIPLERPRVVTKTTHGTGWHVGQGDGAEGDGHVAKRILR